MSDDKAKEKKFLNDLVDEQETTKAYQKLHREPLRVSVYKNSSLVQRLEASLDMINDEIAKCKNEEDKKKLEEAKSELTQKLKKEESSKIEGYLTKLTYRDLNDIKAAVTEAVIHFKKYNFDDNVVLSRVVAEERFMTVFCALKGLDKKKKYFNSLEEIAMSDDVTILDLYDKWERHFCLSEEDIKNS